jgi:DNA end-binding protein Ku
VNLYPAIRTARASLRMLSPDGVPLSRRYYSQKSDGALDDDEMVRGYEIEDGEYVVVTDEELERLEPKKTRDIDVRLFVDQHSIPPIYFERAYFLTPGGNSEKAYRLLAETMEKSGRAGIATFVMRGKEYLIAIFAENGLLRAETMRFADELRSPDQIGLPKKKKVPKQTATKFEKLIAKKSEDRLSPNEMKDEETEQVLKLVKTKRSKHKDIVETDDAEEQKGKVVDIMDVLKKSIAAKR